MEQDRLQKLEKQLYTACKITGMKGTCCCPMFALSHVLKDIGELTSVDLTEAFRNHLNLTHDEMFSFIEGFDNFYYEISKRDTDLKELGSKFRTMQINGDFQK